MAEQNAGTQQGTHQELQNVATQQPQQGISFDYDKLAQIINGRTSTAEDAALKGYFKQQGLSQQEVEQAIAAFKQQKAEQTPDVGAMQAELSKANTLAREAQLQSAATIAAVEMGIDAKTIPYVLKMADLKNVVGADGAINEETLNEALKKVLEDVPALKPQAVGNGGFVQVGSSGAGNTQQTVDTELDRIFGIKKK